MLLAHKFADPQANQTSELFLRMIKDLFEDQLISVVVYGSITLDDLAPGYGDLDFLAVVQDDLSDEMCRRLCEIRRPLRSGEHGVLAKMIEGAFMPRHMLNPVNPGKGFWWGTSGERSFERNQLGWLELHLIREQGIVIWGEDIRCGIPVASHKALLEDVWKYCKSIREHGQAGSLHSVDWLLTASRLLLWLKEGRLTSKSEAADWGHLHVKGSWHKLLPRAKEIRLNPALAEPADLKKWLRTLEEPIMEACKEVERELLAQGSKLREGA